MKKLLYIIVILLVVGGLYLLANGNNQQKMAVVNSNAENSKGDVSNLDATNKATSTDTSLNANTSTSTSASTNTAPIGGNKDSHGCVLGGGYSWDASVGKCIRPWEKLSVLIPSKKWYLVNADGTISNSIYFETNTAGTQFSGKACNSFSGSIKINDKASSVYISNAVSTMMACADNNMMNIESKLLSMTSGTAQVSLNEDTGHITLTASPLGIKLQVEFAPKDK